MRRYSMTRIRDGDYLLPSNDAQTLWRITRYTEDGSAAWVDPDNGSEHPIVGIFWSAAKYNGSLDRLPDDLTDWEHWDHWSDMHRTRREAVVEIVP